MKDILSNVEIERSFLGCILIDNTVLDTIDDLWPGHFFSSAHKIIFGAMLAMYKLRRPIDYGTLDDQLMREDKLKRVGGSKYIAALTDAVPWVGHAEAYAASIKERAQIREMYAQALGIIEQIKGGANPPEVAGLFSAGSDIFISSRHLLAEPVANYQALEDYQTGPSGGYCLTGFHSIDRNHAPGCDDLVIIAARPSIGKTALTLAIAEKMANRGEAGLFISIEMGSESINFRRAASMSGVELVAMRRKAGIMPNQWQQVADSFDRISKTPMFVMSGSYSLDELRAEIKSAKNRHNIKWFVIDHLGLVRLPRKDRRDLELGQTTQDLARLTKDLGITGFVLCQLNRQVENRDSKRPKVSDLRDSGRIEEDADAIWLLFRPGRYDENAGDDFDIIVGKNRNGPCGTVKMKVEIETGRFEDGSLGF